MTRADIYTHLLASGTPNIETPISLGNWYKLSTFTVEFERRAWVVAILLPNDEERDVDGWIVLDWRPVDGLAWDQRASIADLIDRNPLPTPKTQ